MLQFPTTWHLSEASLQVPLSVSAALWQAVLCSLSPQISWSVTLGLNHTLTLIAAHGLVCGEGCRCPFLLLSSCVNFSDQDQQRENNWKDETRKGDVKGITHLLTTTSYPLDRQRIKKKKQKDIKIILKGPDQPNCNTKKAQFWLSLTYLHDAGGEMVQVWELGHSALLYNACGIFLLPSAQPFHHDESKLTDIQYLQQPRAPPICWGAAFTAACVCRQFLMNFWKQQVYLTSKRYSKPAAEQTERFWS